MHIDVLEAIADKKPVEGLTHNFYRYPARFSPRFAREMIRHFSEPGDLVYDPFVGGGTTLVEARAQGRLAIGTDVNALGIFVSRVKTTRLSSTEIEEVADWSEQILPLINLRKSAKRPDEEWLEKGYQANISGKETWQIRKTIELFLEQVTKLKKDKQRDFARCVVLSTAQWALDCRSSVPNATEFRRKFVAIMEQMIEGITDYSELARANKLERRFGRDGVICLHRSVMDADKVRILKSNPPKLIVTSPPYPATHVLYHRWQVQGRKETKAPFWIANEHDGHYAPYYCMGERRRPGNLDYFENIERAFSALAKIADENTLIAQMVAFPDPTWQLEEYLSAMKQAGFRELKKGKNLSSDGRMWRDVPNRRFYAGLNGYGTSQEVVLFHKLR